MIRGIMESPDGKTVYATAEHHKAAIPTKPEFLERLKSMREEDKSRL
jgi:acyl-coenzyme A thioesterase 13